LLIIKGKWILRICLAKFKLKGQQYNFTLNSL